MRRELRLTSSEAAYSVLGDGAVVPAFGVLGGRSGVPVGSHVLRNGEALQFPTPGKVSGFRMVRDDVLVLQSAGGGGYGDPLDREPERVAVDVREGLVSSVCARDIYGVVLHEDGASARVVDGPATAALREALRRSRFRLTVLATDSPQYEAGSVSRRRIARLHPDDAARAGFAFSTLVELVGARVPLRAWVVIDPAVPVGQVPTDELARRVLSVAPGVSLEIRSV